MFKTFFLVFYIFLKEDVSRFPKTKISVLDIHKQKCVTTFFSATILCSILITNLNLKIMII